MLINEFHKLEARNWKHSASRRYWEVLRHHTWNNRLQTWKDFYNFKQKAFIVFWVIRDNNQFCRTINLASFSEP